MNEKGTYQVTFKFSNISKEELERLLDELFQNVGIIPCRVEKVKE